MRNDKTNRITNIISLTGTLPYFSLNDLASVEQNKNYLKILFSRYEKAGKIFRLKKGVYVTKTYIDTIEKNNEISRYPEFLSAILYPNSYLSLEYILYQNNLLTEIPTTFTAMTTNKTKHFSNRFGTYIYHSIKNTLYTGFDVILEGSFRIARATKAKAVFDFLYLRKNMLKNEKAVDELRLNLSELNKADKKELKSYINLENSRRLKEVCRLLLR